MNTIDSADRTAFTALETSDEELDALFRASMAEVATPVTVVTAMDGDRPHGTTVSAFASLSMSPPMILVSLDRGSQLLSVIQRTRTFGVNVLGNDHAGLASAFARKGDDKFSGLDWERSESLPRLEGALVWIACDIADIVPGGDHLIVLGNVTGLRTESGLPLTYHRRTFGTHRPIE